MTEIAPPAMLGHTAIRSEQTAALTLDGLADHVCLRAVVCRILLCCSVYGITTSVFTAGFVAATRLTLFGLGPAQMAVLNAVAVIYFTAIMLPVSLTLAYLFRYNQDSPLQRWSVDVSVPTSDALQLALVAMLSLPGTKLIKLDELDGRILCSAPRRWAAGPQNILATIEATSASTSRLTFSSTPKLGAIEYLLFGYTLAIDGGANRRNIERIATFLRYG
jgi:hypothetical protein